MKMRSAGWMPAMVMVCCLFLGALSVQAEDKDRDEEKTLSVRLPGSEIVLAQGMSEMELAKEFRPGALALDSSADKGSGMADVKAGFGSYIVMLTTDKHELKSFTVSPTDTGQTRAANSLRAWFDSGVKHLKKPQHKTGKTEMGVPCETWSTPEIEWSIWTVEDKPTHFRHPVYHVTFTAPQAEDDD